MMVLFGEPVAEPSSDAIQARQAMAQWDAPSPMLLPLILRYGFEVLGDRMHVTPFSEVKCER